MSSSTDGPLSGVKPGTYWSAALLWDLVLYTASATLCIFIFLIFDAKERGRYCGAGSVELCHCYCGYRHCAALFLWLLGYCTVLGYCYCAGLLYCVLGYCYCAGLLYCVRLLLLCWVTVLCIRLLLLCWVTVLC
jgi:hypothetical protein